MADSVWASELLAQTASSYFQEVKMLGVANRVRYRSATTALTRAETSNSVKPLAVAFAKVSSAVVASALPAIRAARVDVMQALRSE
jgi:ABC-type lipoprotein release transport system permease subunit